MTESIRSTWTDLQAGPCLDRRAVTACLNSMLQWPAGLRAEDVTIKRMYAGRKRDLEFEFAVALSGRRSGDEAEPSLYARCPAGELDPSRISTKPHLTDHGLSGIQFSDETLNLTFQSYDKDARLAHLHQCLDSDFMTSRLAPMWAKAEHRRFEKAQPVQCRLLAYRRAKRCVIHYRYPSKQDAPSVVGKSFCNHRGEKITGWHEMLRRHLMNMTSGRIDVPAVLDYDRRLKTVFMQGMTSQDHRLPCLTPEARARCAAEALVALHAAPLQGMDVYSGDEHWDILMRWHDVICAMKPEWQRDSETVMALLAEKRGSEASQTPVLLHRDYYASQIQISRRGITLFDLDTLAAGDRNVDIGNYLAHEWLWCLQQGRSARTLASIAERMLETYERQVGRLNDDALAYQWASSLYRVGAIHAFRHCMSQYAGDLWEMARVMMQQGRDALASWKSDRPIWRSRQNLRSNKIQQG